MTYPTKKSLPPPTDRKAAAAAAARIDQETERTMGTFEIDGHLSQERHWLHRSADRDRRRPNLPTDGRTDALSTIIEFEWAARAASEEKTTYATAASSERVSAVQVT